MSEADVREAVEEKTKPVFDEQTAKAAKEEGLDSGWNSIITEFPLDLEMFPTRAAMCFYGKRRSGKTTTIKNLAPLILEGIPFGLVMSNTAMTGAWDDLLPPRHIIQGLRMDILKWFVKRQNGLVAKFGKDADQTQAFIIFDDVIADEKAIRYNNKELLEFFVQGRHMGITVLLASQNIKGIPPKIRINTDYSFVQPIYNVNERAALWELNGGVLSKKVFIEMLSQVAVARELEGHTPRNPKKEVTVLVCAGHAESNDPSKVFFRFKPVHEDMVDNKPLCAPEYWKQQNLEVKLEMGAGSAKAPMAVQIHKEIEKVNKLLK